MRRLYYCKRCGRLVIEGSYEEKEDTETYHCDCCGAVVYKVPSEFLVEEIPDLMKSQEIKEQFIEEYIKKSPEFDQQAFDSRDDILMAQHMQYKQMMAQYGPGSKGKSGRPQCPICGSTSISSIGLLNRAVSVGLFGLASSKIGKTHKCNRCGSTW